MGTFEDDHFVIHPGLSGLAEVAQTSPAEAGISAILANAEENSSNKATGGL